MVEPSWRSWWASALAGSCAVLALGCSSVPKSRLDECRQWSRHLQAENARLKDVALNLRSENQDLNQRAEDDAQRLALQDEAVERLEQSVMAYQAERDQLTARYERLKDQIAASAGLLSSPLLSGAESSSKVGTAR